MSKDKRIPLNQVIQMIHDFYDDFEGASLPALQQALYEELGVGAQRFARVKDRYLEYLGVEAEKRVVEMQRKVRRRLT